MSIVLSAPITSQPGGGYTFLQLAQRVRQECRVTGTGPSSVINQNAELTRILTWTNEASMEIQRSNPKWNFLRGSCSVTTQAGKTTYSAADFGLTDWGSWALDYDSGDTFRNYNTSAGLNSEVPMSPIDYDNWRNTYLFGAARATFTRPIVVAQAPDNSLAFGPITAAGYTIIGEYYKAPQDLILSTDTPLIPPQFQMAVVFKAMQYYGASEAASEVFDIGARQFAIIHRALVNHQLPRYRLAGALC